MSQRTTINYRNNEALTADLKEVLAEFDLTKTGTVTTSELVAGAEALREVRGQNVFMKKASGVLALMLVLLLAGMFGVTIMAVELTRETKVLNAKLVAADGSPVQAAQGAGGRRAAPGGQFLWAILKLRPSAATEGVVCQRLGFPKAAQTSSLNPENPDRRAVGNSVIAVPNCFLPNCFLPKFWKVQKV